MTRDFSSSRRHPLVDGDNDDSMSSISHHVLKSSLSLSNSTLHSASLPLLMSLDSLLETTTVSSNLALALVTKFKCGGFTLGIGLNHSMADGVSAMNFFNSWAETARAKPISAIPFHDRTLLKTRMPPQIKGPYADVVEVTDSSNMEAYYQKEGLISRSFHFDSEKLAKIKKMALAGASLKNCSTFVALSALIKRARSKAFNMKPHQLTKLRIMVDFRQKLKDLPEGFFDNGMTTVGFVCTSGELIVTEEYVRTKIDFVGLYKPQLTSVETLVISLWTRLAYGWPRQR